MGLWREVKDRVFRRNDREMVDREGRDAFRWLHDPTLDAALAEVRESAIDTWSLSRDPETRERAWLMVQQTDLFAASLTSAMQRMQAQEKAQP